VEEKQQAATPESEAKEPQTVQQRGAVLPLGITDATGNLHRDLAVRRWRMKEERELGELRDKHKDANLATYVAMVLATMCTRLGPHDFSKMKFEERCLILSQMFMGDVFYAYVWLRINCLGNVFPIEFQPGWSNKPLKIKADLWSVVVKSAETFDEACWRYELNDPIEIRGTEVKAFKMAPQRWASMEQHDAVGAGANQGLAKLIIIKSSIHECEGIDGQIILTDDELDEMSKLDLERLTTLCDEKVLGPQMAVEGEHKGRPFRAPIDWGYDNFFGISSV